MKQESIDALALMAKQAARRVDKMSERIAHMLEMRGRAAEEQIKLEALLSEAKKAK